MDCLDHGSRVFRGYAGVYAVSQIEHVAIAFTETGQHFGDLFTDMLR